MITINLSIELFINQPNQMKSYKLSNNFVSSCLIVLDARRITQTPDP